MERGSELRADDYSPPASSCHESRENFTTTTGRAVVSNINYIPFIRSCIVCDASSPLLRRIELVQSGCWRRTGISRYSIQPAGDLVWRAGTGTNYILRYLCTAIPRAPRIAAARPSEIRHLNQTWFDYTSANINEYRLCCTVMDKVHP